MTVMPTKTHDSAAKCRVAILSCAGDLHAILIQKALRSKGVLCDLVETDALSGSPGLTWEDGSASVPTSEQKLVDPSDWDVIWARRMNYPQLRTKAQAETPANSIINNDCKATLLGAISTQFNGIWIDSPASVQSAENKLIQLHLAKSVGLRVPRTLISQDPDRIRAFFLSHPEGVIFKTVRGISTHPLLALMLSPEMLLDDDTLRISPTCYQQYIPGKIHLRVNCFGHRTFAFEIESDQMDWRQNLNVPIRKVELKPELENQLKKVMRLLNLQMGVFDLKIDETNGDPVWLEVNPQGQFLFLEGLTGVDLIEHFTTFVLETHRVSRALRRRR